MINLKTPLRRGLEHIEAGFDRVFTPALNPFYQLGALGWFFFWIVAVTGIYLYIFFDTGITNAYESVERITHAQWYAGGVMRSLHRYASDGLVIVAMLHLAREFLRGRYRGVRWFTWFTGVPLLWLMFAAGLSGYWVVWDMLAQYVAVALTEWLDAIPVFGEPIARNFLNPEALSSRFFTLLVFIHIFAPLAMLMVMWIHVARLSRPGVNPPRALAGATLVALLALSLVQPAVSHDAADLDRVPALLQLDWFYMFPLPLLDTLSGAALWALVLGATLLLMAMPWLPPRRRPAAAVVDLDNCNGCGRCVADCPYSAVTLIPRKAVSPFTEQAEVNADNCVSCGLCVGACPTATPFRRRSALVAGIELPEQPLIGLRDRLAALAGPLIGHNRVLLVGCPHGPRIEACRSDSVATLTVPCTGFLPPAFLDLIISRRQFDGVFLAGCRENNCFHRRGNTWTAQRIDGERDPALRPRVPRGLIGRGWLGGKSTA
ncbi:MAG: cytochrome b N-terminal domain-containing protein, partial [Gammaproteobacteria bacterium]|nr:cytochrome b N-terminal domain-containing protein [Gammaproteobacteria bacterium]